MNIIFFDQPFRESLLPLVYMNPVSQLRIGALTIEEKWLYYFKNSVIEYDTADYLTTLFKSYSGSLKDIVFIAGNCCPTDRLANEVLSLKTNESLVFNGQLIAFKGETLSEANYSTTKHYSNDPEILLLQRPYDLFINNAAQLQLDFKRLTINNVSQAISSTNTVIGDQLFVEPGAKVECSIINTLTGPVYLAADSEIMEGSIIRGGLYLGNHSQVKMGAKLYGATTIGPESRIGGEVNNCVIQGYSNKGHDGFLGNSVLGKWCNLGADTNNSNLKNNYDEVKIYHYASKQPEKTGLQFCGLFMGDHSKSGINTMFNTGTVVGFSSNIFGGGFPPTFIPSFSWGGADGLAVYQLDKAIETMKRVYARRNKTLSKEEESVIRHLFELTEVERKF
jgi:UDP-N-acetylglucosamine diphosphorylase/glucosamine-1-phosphate N-acetyltransferase